MRAFMGLLNTNRSKLIAIHLFFYVGFAALRSVIAPLSLIEATTLCALLIWISVHDMETFEIPDGASFLLLITGLASAWFLHRPDFPDRVIGGLFWSIAFWAVGSGYFRLRGWDGLGFGDVKLMLGLGFWLGLMHTTIAVFIASMSGILTLLLVTILRQRSFRPIGKTAVAFGPYLCLSVWVNWLARGII